MILRELVRQNFNFIQTDPVPYYIPMEPEIESQLNRYYGKEKLQEKLTPYFYMGHYGTGRTSLGNGTVIDKFGTITEEQNITHIVKPALSSPSMKNYIWPTPDDLEDWNMLARRYREKDTSYRICGLAYGLFERSWHMRGMENILMDMILHPDFVNRLMDGIMEIHLKVMNLIIDKIPIDAYFGGDVEVNGDLYVGGDQVIPDYVFEENYNLMSIAELEIFVRANKHLPNIRNREDGGTRVNIIGFQYSLLEKIEELYLYLFGINHRVEELEERVKYLEDKCG